MDQLHPFPSATDLPDDMWGLRARVFLLLGLPSSPNKPRTLLKSRQDRVRCDPMNKPDFRV
jgi:hypothetical protein